MHLLVTRPEPDAADLKRRLEAIGHRVSLSALLAIEFAEGEPIRLDNVQALIATSRNGLRALAQSPVLAEALALPVFAVGPATAALSRSLGFSRVLEGPGSARDLVPLIAANAEPAGGSLLHLAGAQLAFDLKEALEHEGFTVSQPVVYRSQAATSFDPQVADAIRSSLLDGVILLSPRTAEIFVTLATKAGLAEAARKLTFYCMSDAVARPLDALAPININIAAQPNSQEILALIARMAPESG